MPLAAMRQLPVIVLESAVRTLTPSPTDAPPTLTLLAAITATPVIGYSQPNVMVYAGPGYEYATIAMLYNSQYDFVGVTENREWYLINTPGLPRGWIPANSMGTLSSGSLRFVPVISEAQMRVMVTSLPTVTRTPPRSPRPTLGILPSTTLTPVVAQLVGDPRVRAGPDDSYPIIAQVEANSVYYVVAVSEDENWYLAKFIGYQSADGVQLQGWVIKGPAHIPMSGNLDSVPVANPTQAPMMVTALTPISTQPLVLTFTPTVNLTSSRPRTPSPTPT